MAAAIESTSGTIYTGVSVDTSCTLGICAERNAIFHMLTMGESPSAGCWPSGMMAGTAAPCGACRELMCQLMPGHYADIEIMLDYQTSRVATLGQLTPEWWL